MAYCISFNFLLQFLETDRLIFGGGVWDFYEKNIVCFRTGEKKYRSKKNKMRSEKNKMSSTKLKIKSLFFIQRIFFKPFSLGAIKVCK